MFCKITCKNKLKIRSGFQVSREWALHTTLVNCQAKLGRVEPCVKVTSAIEGNKVTSAIEGNRLDKRERNDETLPIINKPKHQNKGKTRYKMEGPKS